MVELGSEITAFHYLIAQPARFVDADAGSGHVLWMPSAMMTVGNCLGGWLGSKAVIGSTPKVVRALLVIRILGLTIKLMTNPGDLLGHLVEQFF
jgi:uncharacterized membrane protein YfcA